MGFAALAPEVTSDWMYSGPGSGPMLSAAAAWDRLAGELSSAASDYQAVISSLADNQWRGPAAASMSAAAAPSAAWMTTTAEQARQAAVQARAASAAYQEARGAVVPPPVISANRALLQQLVATNVMGQNTAAIAENQAEYGEMWAQNATAMHTYAGTSAAAATLTPFSEPKQNTNPAGQANQAAATKSSQIPGLLQALSSGNLTNVVSGLNQYLETPGFELFTLFGTSFGGLLETLGAPGFMFISPLFWMIPVIFSWFPSIVGGTSAAVTISDVSGLPAGALGSTLVGSSSLSASLGGGPLPALTAPNVSAGVGRAGLVGGLSVPQAWGASGVKLASTAAPLSSAAGASGLHGNMPPIASVVNAPRGTGAVGSRNPLRSKLIPELGPGSSAGWNGRGTPDIVNPLNEYEREELESLRAELADLVMEQDAVTRLMNQAFKA